MMKTKDTTHTSTLYTPLSGTPRRRCNAISNANASAIAILP